MIYTTLNRIHACSPRADHWKKLLRNLGKTKPDDELVSFATIGGSNGLDFALWCCIAEPQHSNLWRHCAVDFAETVRHLMVDTRSLAALDAARRRADGEEEEEEDLAAAAAARTLAISAALDNSRPSAKAAAASAAAWAASPKESYLAAEFAAACAANAAAWEASPAASEDQACAVAWITARGAAESHLLALFLARLEAEQQ